LIGEILAETDLPKGAFSILPCQTEDAELMVQDTRFKVLSFTGSAKVGWELKTKAQKMPVILELGGNAACVVDENADIEWAAERLVFGAFYQSGQSCISVQRIYIHETLYAQLKEKFIEKTKSLKIGDPKKKETFIGPMISEKEAIRVQNWIE